MSRIVKLLATGFLTITVVAGSIVAGGCSTTESATTVAPETQATSTVDQVPTNGQSGTPQGFNPGEGQPAIEGQNGVPGEGQGQPPEIENQLAQVAAILGIEEQTLKDAFNQAMSELGDQGMPTPPEISGTPTPPTDTPPAMDENGTPVPPPDGQLPPGMGVPGLSDELLAKVASILGIDQQTLKDAFAQLSTPTATATATTETQ